MVEGLPVRAVLCAVECPGYHREGARGAALDRSKTNPSTVSQPQFSMAKQRDDDHQSAVNFPSRMPVTLDLPERYLAAAPVIVTSPETRCGTTLVQRLLCATDNAFVYGEEIGAQFRSLSALFAAQIRQCDANGAAMDEGFYRALSGALQEWRPGLTPPARVVLSAWTEAFYQLPATLSAFGELVGRPIWGFKWPGCSLQDVRALRTLMPRTRVVYVLRNLPDALASAKARLFVTTKEATARYAANWAANVSAFMTLRDDPAVMILRYEDLLAEPDQTLAALGAFTGAANMRRSELDVRVNTFQGLEADGHSATQYIAPATLTDEDWAVLRAHAGQIMAEHYP